MTNIITLLQGLALKYSHWLCFSTQVQTKNKQAQTYTQIHFLRKDYFRNLPTVHWAVPGFKKL